MEKNNKTLNMILYTTIIILFICIILSEITNNLKDNILLQIGIIFVTFVLFINLTYPCRYVNSDEV